MKRAGLWVIGIGMLCIVGILIVKQGYSAPPKCSNATLNGTYLFSGTSVLIDDPSSNLPQVSAYIAVVGKSTYDGRGKSTALAMLSINGNPNFPLTNLDSEADGVYTVNPDCTGTETLTDRKTLEQHPYAFIVDPEGKELRLLALPTTAEDGAVVRASVSRRVGGDR